MTDSSTGCSTQFYISFAVPPLSPIQFYCTLAVAMTVEPSFTGMHAACARTEGGGRACYQAGGMRVGALRGQQCNQGRWHKRGGQAIQASGMRAGAGACNQGKGRVEGGGVNAGGMKVGGRMMTTGHYPG